MFTCCKLTGIHCSVPSSATSKLCVLPFVIIIKGVKVTILVRLKLLLFIVTPTWKRQKFFSVHAFKMHLYFAQTADICGRRTVKNTTHTASFNLTLFVSHFLWTCGKYFVFFLLYSPFYTRANSVTRTT